MVDILFVEDNIELANVISAFLKRSGYTLFHAVSGESALSYLKENSVKLVLLDISLPGIDGFTVCDSIRKVKNTPIIILSARIDKEDKQNGYLLGADDYIEKPVDIDILTLKIKALLKRNYELKESNTIVTSGNLSVDKAAHTFYKDGKPLVLTIKEYDLLLLFIENPHRTLNKDYLFNQIWGYDSFSENQTLTVHIKMLRDKIEDDPKKPKKIQTVWGVGYKYEEN
ncbi:MAG: response regulator transcription factor [Clostridiales bacterium]|nr:response regulator transcription factor [Clostridiales bacterium]